MGWETSREPIRTVTERTWFASSTEGIGDGRRERSEGLLLPGAWIPVLPAGRFRRAHWLARSASSPQIHIIQSQIRSRRAHGAPIIPLAAHTCFEVATIGR